MDPFNNLPTNASVPGDTTDYESANAVYNITQAWNGLRIQISSFNQIVAIPTAWYGTWGFLERQMIINLMM